MKKSNHKSRSKDDKNEPKFSNSWAASYFNKDNVYVVYVTLFVCSGIKTFPLPIFLNLWVWFPSAPHINNSQAPSCTLSLLSSSCYSNEMSTDEDITSPLMYRPVGNLAFSRTVLRNHTSATDRKRNTFHFYFAMMAHTHLWFLLPCFHMHLLQAFTGSSFSVKL